MKIGSILFHNTCSTDAILLALYGEVPTAHDALCLAIAAIYIYAYAYAETNAAAGEDVHVVVHTYM